MFQTMSTAYAAEILPVNLRPYLISNINMCWLVGQLCGTSVVYAFLGSQSEWAYRIPFGLQWAFLIPILIGIIFAPESPCELYHANSQMADTNSSEGGSSVTVGLTMRKIPFFGSPHLYPWIISMLTKQSP